MESPRKLLAGVARIDITPPIGIELFGYHRPSPMADIHDPLWLTVLALVDEYDPSQPYLLLAIDNIGLGQEATHHIRNAVAANAKTSLERVIVYYSHTHSGPDCEQLDGHGQIRPVDSPERLYGAMLPNWATSATQLALKRLMPAHVGCSTTTSLAGINRRKLGDDGRAVGGVNPAGPVDQQVTVLRIDAIDHRPLAVVVHYGIHGTVFKTDNLACSADVTGAVRDVVEAATGAVCLFAQGAAGDVNPRWRGDEIALQRCGWELGGAALRAFATAEMQPLSALATTAEHISLPLLPLPDEAAAMKQAEDVARIWGTTTAPWLDLIRRKLAANERHLSFSHEVQALRVNEFIRVGIPMEPFAALSLAFREQTAILASDERPLFHCFGGYTNGITGYLAPSVDYPSGGYEIEWMPLVYGYYEGMLMPPVPEASKMVVATAVRLATQLWNEQ
jgi:Neutral/alkaline non-lysosomal ceramidase, N-terminal